MSHSDQVIDIMNAKPQAYQVFAAQLGEQLTRENIFQAREQQLLVCWVSKHYLHLSGTVNAIFDMGKSIAEVQVLLSDENRVFVAGEYTDAIAEKYPPEKYQLITARKSDANWQFNTAILHASFASGIVFSW